jgi:AraC-like DNA-binding protein
MFLDLSSNTFLFGVEYLKSQNAYDMSSHNHNQYELYFLEQNQIDFIVNGTIYTVEKNSVVLIKPNIFHKTTSTSGRTRTCIYFAERFLKMYFSDQSIKTLLQCFEINMISLDAESFSKIKRLSLLLEKENQDEPRNCIFIYLADILNILNSKKSLQILHFPTSLQENITPVLTYINQNYNTLNTLDDISNHFHISKYHLCHIFKKAVNLTVTQYINNIKIQNACTMLAYSGKSISEVGLECGFNSAMYFCKTFKKILNITPSEFRINIK